MSTSLDNTKFIAGETVVLLRSEVYTLTAKRKLDGPIKFVASGTGPRPQLVFLGPKEQPFFSAGKISGVSFDNIDFYAANGGSVALMAERTTDIAFTNCGMQYGGGLLLGQAVSNVLLQDIYCGVLPGYPIKFGTIMTDDEKPGCSNITARRLTLLGSSGQTAFRAHAVTNLLIEDSYIGNRNHIDKKAACRIHDGNTVTVRRTHFDGDACFGTLTGGDGGEDVRKIGADGKPIDGTEDSAKKKLRDEFYRLLRLKNVTVEESQFSTYVKLSAGLENLIFRRTFVKSKNSACFSVEGPYGPKLPAQGVIEDCDGRYYGGGTGQFVKGDASRLVFKGKHNTYQGVSL